MRISNLIPASREVYGINDDGRNTITTKTTPNRYMVSGGSGIVNRDDWGNLGSSVLEILICDYDAGVLKSSVAILGAAQLKQKKRKHTQKVVRRKKRGESRRHQRRSLMIASQHRSLLFSAPHFFLRGGQDSINHRTRTLLSTLISSVSKICLCSMERRCCSRRHHLSQLGSKKAAALVDGWMYRCRSHHLHG